MNWYRLSQDEENWHPPDWDKKDWNRLDPDEQKAYRYFAIGQQDDGNNKNYCWTWLNDQLEVRQGKTHGANFGHYYTDRTFKGGGDPISHIMFRNQFTVLVQPYRLLYKKKSYGDNTKFLVAFKFKNDKEQVIPIRPKSLWALPFDFDLPPEAVETEASLKSFLDGKMDDLRKKEVVGFEIINMEERRRDYYRNIECENITDGSPLVCRSWFQYRVIGSILTRKRSADLRKKNKK